MHKETIFIKIIAFYLILTAPLFGDEWAAIPSSALQIPKELTEVWQQALERKTLEEIYTDEPILLTGMMIYKENPIDFRFFIEKQGWRLELHDPQDSLMLEKGVPFIVIGIENTIFTSDIGRSDHFHGKDIIAIASALGLYFGIDKFLISDSASTIQCPYDQAYCLDESLMALKSMNVQLTGKSFYEIYGAKASDSPAYRLAADFTHNIEVIHLLDDLSKISHINKAQVLYSKLREYQQRTGLQGPGVTLGQLGYFLRVHNGDSQESHAMWHDFHDYFIANKGSIQLELMKYELEIESPSDALLLCILTNALVNMEQYYSNLQMQAQQINNMKDPFVIEVKKILAGFPHNMKEAQDLYLHRKTQFIITADTTQSPYLFTLAHRASPKSIERYFRYYEYFQADEHSGELYKKIYESLNKIYSKNGITKVDINNNYQSLIDDYSRQDRKNLPPGYLTALFLESKYIVLSTKYFMFGEIMGTPK